MKISIKQIKHRYKICKACPDTLDAGHACKHHAACCFGVWRTKPENDCPKNRWPKLEHTEENEVQHGE
jgi:hypothetical protein